MEKKSFFYHCIAPEFSVLYPLNNYPEGNNN